MANSLEFKISAEDQASRVVETVQGKIQNFGRDVAKMALGFAGPLALVQLGFQKIGDAYEEMQKKRQEAVDAGAAGMYDELKVRQKITAQLEKGYSILLAQKKLNEENSAKAEQEKLSREEATRAFLENSKRGNEIQSQNMSFDPESGTTFKTPIGVLARKPEIQAEALKSTEDLINALDAEKEKLNQQKASWDALAQSIKEYNDKLAQGERSRKQELEYVNRIKKAESDLFDLENKRKETASKSITVSSLREMGGGIYGESQAIANQNLSAPAQTDQLTTQLKESATDYVTAARIMKESADKLVITYTDFGKLITSMPSVSGSTFTGQSPLNND